MMKRTLLSTAAAAALIASLGTVSAQTERGAGGSPGGASSGAMERSAPSGGMERGGAAGERSSGTVGQAPSKAEPSNPNQAQNPASNASGSKHDDMKAQAPANNGAMKSDKATSERSESQSRTTGEARQNAPQGKTDSNAQAAPNQKGTVGAASSSETKMTTEQRTQIRDKVVATGPKVNHIDFSLNVGTVVPRTVHVAEVPPVIVDIHPEWRGYRYFVVNDQVIIVERDSLRIVAVLDV